MTTYSYKLTLTDREVIALNAAMDAYFDHCAGKISGGAGPPYRTHVDALEAVRARLYSDSTMTS